MDDLVRNIGVEEEFHLVDLRTRRLTPRAPELLDALPDTGGYVEELQRCVIEVNSGVFSKLSDLRQDLREHRAILAKTAADLGIGVVAAGGVPLAVPTELQVTESPRYRQMLADYQLLAREQLICGTQVHVDVANRDQAVQLAWRLSPYIPTLLALSASSPFWSDGSDTGYASSRTLVWQRWPTTGPFPRLESAAEYDDEIARLISTGVITDPGMVYYDVRPSAMQPTLEIRACDSCPSVDTIALIAGLYRALVQREVAGMEQGRAGIDVSPTLYRAAIWQAARSGLEADLIDVVAAEPRPAAEIIGDLAAMLQPQLEATGDWDTVIELIDTAISVGSSSARQRRALRRRGHLSDVVDTLIAETAGDAPASPRMVDPANPMVHTYSPAVGVEPTPDDYDEVFDPAGLARPDYARVAETVTGLGPIALRNRQHQMEGQQSAGGMTFKVSGQARPQIFSLDVMPRIIDAPTWDGISVGLRQRALALNAFLIDVYGEQQIIGDAVIPAEILDRAPGYRSAGAAPLSQPVRTHICGTDLISTGPGKFQVLEDNLRVPSGIAFAISNRTLMTRYLGELFGPEDIESVDGIPQMIADTLDAAQPPNAATDGVTVLLSAGWEDSAWFEHSMIAERAGIAVVDCPDLRADGKGLSARIRGKDVRVNVIFARMDEDMLLSSVGADGEALRHPILNALAAGTLSIANALGNGIADDKAVYSFVPEMIRYYLNEEPAIEQIPTWLCAEREQRDHVLSRMEELVIKPIDGLGGSGVMIGPEATEQELAERRKDLIGHPERFVAQEVVRLSTHPTFDGQGLYPHHVDLRAFVHLRADGNDQVTAHMVPAALTRVAPSGSMIVNSSRGGGGKDTWILTGTQNEGR
ncbi:carboxylate--amine ligase/circularly permuted type 2 ATP-grasp protein [Williamsia sp. 1135]|uniref:carboxylate--amine ligase/circularly permuted type 2 ATP-grasp protein n=1 Tax=Williamsia sp. 1135 TaxID=1889262 RepID=UPI000A11BA31|nr:carboxylate--amine ligase/circularly permuted type 2 ATP-grasp protein [Williamsia sp. 1135]ORM25012.1 carboxylate--amine ligase [Williamsia sp. 1135]